MAKKKPSVTQTPTMKKQKEDSFINEGGSSPSNTPQKKKPKTTEKKPPPQKKPKKKDSRTHFQIRVEPNIVEQIETALTKEPVKISRNYWIVQAILEKLQRDGKK